MLDQPTSSSADTQSETDVVSSSADFTFDFFLSFSGRDAELAQRARDLLTNFGYKVIYQDEHFRIGSSFLQEMDQAHLASRKVIALVTPNYFATSPHTAVEFEAALLGQKLLIFRFHGASIPPSASSQIRVDFPDELTSAKSLELLESAARLKPMRTADMTQTVHLEALPKWQGGEESRAHQRLIGRDRELAQMTSALRSGTTNMVCVIADGGFGKSALVQQWLKEQAKSGYDRVSVVYGYSFYKQGFEGGSAVLTRPFFVDCLAKLTNRSEKFFEDYPDRELPAEILRFLQQRRVLLILDGLEPHQAPRHSSEAGNFTQRDMDEFMTKLLGINNGGLCIVTSRIMPRSLIRDTTVQITLKALDHLSSVEAFLAAGLSPTCPDLDAWATKSGGHPLLISLLAPAIESGHYDPEMFSSDQVVTNHNANNIPETVQNVVSTRLQQLGDQANAVMYCVSLFGHAVSYGELRDEVMDRKKIPIFTTPLYSPKARSNHSSQELFRAGVDALSKAAMITAHGHPQDAASWMLEAHPLVQAGVRCVAETRHPDLWKEANWTVYTSIVKSVTEELPEKVRDLRRLYAAVPHGVQAGKGKRAGWMYAKRCLRGFRGYSTNRGMVADDVALISHYFKGNFEYLREDIGLNTFAKIQANVWAGVLLTAVNRADQGIGLMKIGMEEAQKARSFSTAARVARFLGVLSAMRGDLIEGERLLRQSLADMDQRSNLVSRFFDLKLVDRNFQRMASYTMLGSILHEQGRFTEAEASFHDAELIQRKATRFTGLRNVWCYRKVDFLYDAERFDEARAELAAASVDAEEPKGWGEGVFVDVILKLSRIRGAVREADFLGTAPDPQVLNQGELALKELEMDQGTRMDWLLPIAKIAVAGKARLTSSPLRARDLLAEAESLIHKSGNIIFQVDLLIERSRLHLAGDDLEKAQGVVREASELAIRLGYLCRSGEILKLQTLSETKLASRRV